MGRTTEEKKGKTVILRLSEEMYSEVQRESSRDGVSISEYVRGRIRECNTQKSRERGNSVIQNAEIGLREEEYADLVKMCEVSGIELREFMERVYEMFRDGEIYIEGRRVKVKGKYDIRELEDICHRVNADPQDMINRLTKSLLRG